jgi:hypothetical protein
MGARGGGGSSGTIARGCVVMVVRFRTSLSARAIASKGGGQREPWDHS